MGRAEWYTVAVVGLGLGVAGTCWAISWILGDIVRRRK